MSDYKASFLRQLVPPVQAMCRATGLPASVVLAQAVLESDWGRSELAQRHSNLFGIKAHGGPGAPAGVRFITTEYAGEQARSELAGFAAYASFEACLEDYARLLAGSRYARARAVAANPFAFAVELQRCGYATDPHYAHKLAVLMRRYRLTDFDLLPASAEPAVIEST